MFFLTLVLATAPLLAFAMSSGTIGFLDKFIAFLLLGANASLSFFFISYYDILFSSNQKRFILSAAGLLEKIIYYGLVIFIIINKNSFLWLYLIAIISTVIKILFLFLIFSFTYKKHIKFKYDKTYKIPNRGYLMCNQIARQTVDGCPSILLSIINGLGVVSIFSVYNLVFNMVKILSTTTQTSISEIFGNVTVCEKKEKINEVYDLIGYVFFIMALILCGCTAFLYLPFVFVYSKGNTLDLDYMYWLPTLLFAVYGVIFINYHPIYTLSNVLGFYKDTYLQSVITAIISVGLSIGLAFINWALVVVGLIFYYGVSYIFRTYVVIKKTKYDYVNVRKSTCRLCFSFMITAGLWLFSYFYYNNNYKNSWSLWLITAFIVGVSTIILALLYSLVFEKKQLFNMFRYIKSLLRRKKGSKFMGKIKKAFKYCFNSNYRFVVRSNKGAYSKMDDVVYLKKKYKAITGCNLDLENPKTYNEKLQWLKIYNRNPLYPSLVDKYKCKDYVEKTIGKEYVIPTLGVYNTFEEIDFSKLPNQFVIKVTHDSGGLIICKDKTKLNMKSAKKKITASLNRDYFLPGREWPYKNVERRIIVEKYMSDGDSNYLRDYKFFVFDGIVKALFVASDRQKASEETKFDFFDENYNPLNIRNGHPNSLILPDKPQNFDLMKKLAEKLASGLPHARVDLYEINGQVYFGEITFFHHGGFVPFEPDCWNYTFGDWIKLPPKFNTEENV